MPESLFNEGLTLMLAGMGTVFVFLTTLVFAMTLMSAFAKRVNPATDELDSEVVAAISAAIKTHQQR
ncbi:MAG: hypothetical protein HKN77_05475 [Woeseiaceae bacterium]|nr:hypothetical protein [Woeseiaceae bacterium]